MTSKDYSHGKTTDPRIAFFDQHAHDWDQNGPDIGQTLSRLEEHRDLLGLEPGNDLLELGCGTGQITQWLADAVRPGKVVALDFSPTMLEKAEAKHIDAEFRCLDICTHLVEEQQYDVVLCFHCFPHLRHQPQALRNMERALKPGGRLIVMHLAGSVQINAFHDSVGGAVASDHLPDKNQWQSMLAETNLQLNECIDREDLFFLRADKSE
jgi:demethylmenaquinone methyltransferase/2-methoxy-6-polyprenyl-1,4-benzoquinol methylase